MLSRNSFSAIAAVLLAGVSFTSAIASPVAPSNDTVVSPTESTRTSQNAPAVPASVTTPSDATANAVEAERARLNSAIFASPNSGLNATTPGVLPRIPFEDHRSLSSNELSPRYDLRYNGKYDPMALRSQEPIDRIGDMITPGFGRVEFDMGQNHVRVDYLYSKKCHLRGAGICFRMSF